MNPTIITQLHQLLAKHDKANDFMEQVDQELSQWCNDNPNIDFESIVIEYQALRDAN